MRNVKYWVSSNGDNNNTGTEYQPLATIQEAIRRLRSQQYSTAEVYLKGGKHFLNEPIILTCRDHDITFLSDPHETAEICGSAPISGWEEETVNGIRMWVLQLDEKWHLFHSLFSETENLPRSRWPKRENLFVRNAKDEDGYRGYGPNPDVKLHFAMYVEDKDIPDYYNIQDVTVRILHYWKDEAVNIESFDAASGRVVFSKPATMTIKAGDRFYYENVFEALSEPGEWYLDTNTCKLFYVPRADDDIGSTVLYAGCCEQFLVCDGAKNIHFKSLCFSMSDWSIPVKTVYGCGADHHQAALDVIAAFNFVNTDGISFQKCEFSRINSTCLMFGYNVQNINVIDNRFTDIGANVIQLFGENLEKNNPNVTRCFLISNNHINGYGQRFFNGTAIGIMHAAHGEILNNEVHAGYTNAITVGWVWGYGYSVTSDVLIKRNLIYDIGRNLMSDMGAIYTLGVKEGIIITENVIHGVQANLEFGYGGWGIYMDEGSSNVMVTKNLVYDCNSTAFYQHYGRDNLIINNILAFSGEAQVSSYRHETHTGFHLLRNIIVSEDRDFIRLWDLEIHKAKSRMTEANNIYWDYANGDRNIDTDFYTKTLCLFHNATFKDPLFKDWKNRDFRLKDESEVFALGFIPWDYTKAGLLKVQQQNDY